MTRAGRLVGRHLIMVLGFLVLLYLFVPIIVVILMSFNEPKSKLSYTFDGFTWDNWLHPCRPFGLCEAVSTSLRIGLLATVIATALGTLMAFAMVRHRFRGRSATNLFIFLPMASPEIVLGSSLLALFVSSGFGGQLGFWTILIAHVMFCLSFVVVTVKARLTGMDLRLEQAAMDLYANECADVLADHLPAGLPRHPGRRAAQLLAVVRRLHHHQPERRDHGDVPDVRLGFGAARHPAADQRRRYGDVPARPDPRARRRTDPASKDTMKLAALADAEPRVFWLEDKTAPVPSPALLGPTVADLAVVGGGYTGLWTALRAKERYPGLDVVLLESDTCGSAASGRNGGFCDASLTHGFGNGLARWPEEVDQLEQLGADNLDAIGHTITRFGIDCDWQRTGELTVATAPHHLDELAEEAAPAPRCRAPGPGGGPRRAELTDLPRCAVRSGPDRTGRARPPGLGTTPGLPGARRTHP